MHLLNFLNASSRTETDTSVADACSLYTAESYTEFENFFSVLLTLQKRKTSRTKLMRRRHRQLAAHFSFRTKRFRIPNLFTIVARAQRYTMLLKQSAERTVITNNAFEQILVPDQFYGATYKKYVHQNFFYEEGSKAFLFIVRHSSFCDKYFNKNVDFSFKSFFYFIDSDDTSEKKTPKQIIDAFFGKMPTLKITKTKNKLNICFGAAIKK